MSSNKQKQISVNISIETHEKLEKLKNNSRYNKGQLIDMSVKKLKLV